MRKVLMISYMFPPRGGSMVQRSTYFARYLPAWGFQPIVVHGFSHGYQVPLDPTLATILPRTCRRIDLAELDPARIVSLAANALNLCGRLGRGLAWRVNNTLMRLLHESSPDGHVFWGRWVLPTIVDIIRTCGIDIIYSTSYPYTDHLLGMLAKRETGLPWVADFRDLFTQDRTYQGHCPRKVRRDHIYERQFLTNADAVVHVSHGQSRMAREVAPDVNPKRFHVVHNGFDLTDVLPSPSNSDSFRVSYTGYLPNERWSDSFVLAWHEVFHNETECAASFEFAGIANDRVIGKMQKLGRSLRLHGFLSRQAASRLMLKSDLLLLLINRGRDSQGILTGKLFEYLASGQPILCLSPSDGEAAALVRKHKAGLVADIDSTHQIAEALRTAYGAWASGHPLPGAKLEDVQQYSRRSLTGKLAGIFDEVLEGRS